MKILISILSLVIGVCFLTGCEWTTGGNVTSWDDSGDWVDFSGTYKAPDGKVLVRQFGATASTTNITYTTNTVSSELIATGNGTNTSFNGQLTYSPVRGSLTIFTVGGYRFTDSTSTTNNTVSLSVTPADGSAGTLNYLTRAWALAFPAPIADGTQILATYLYVSAAQTVVALQGNHGDPIYSFVVYQTGNKLQIGDSNGASYEGTIGTVRTIDGQPIDLSDPKAIPPSSGDVVAQFSVTGISQGYKAWLVGVLEREIGSTGRVMQATFIEEGGNEADVKAVAQ